MTVNAPSWLCGVLCYRGYKPAHAQQAPLWEGLRRQGCSSREEEGGTWEVQFFLKTPDYSFQTITQFIHKTQKYFSTICLCSQPLYDPCYLTLTHNFNHCAAQTGFTPDVPTESEEVVFVSRLMKDGCLTLYFKAGLTVPVQPLCQSANTLVTDTIAELLSDQTMILIRRQYPFFRFPVALHVCGIYIQV